ncbi:hypothetical protein [Paenibacillus taichungensis]|uniref:hypothetical protein n=1 Tax=Paenibacillus taichungensis TaxID=484184 RepID=UPI0038CF8793
MSFRQQLTEKLASDYQSEIIVAKGIDAIVRYLEGLKTEWADILNVTNEIVVDTTDKYVKVRNSTLQFRGVSRGIEVFTELGQLDFIAVHQGSLKSARIPDGFLSYDLLDTYLKEVFSQ